MKRRRHLLQTPIAEGANPSDPRVLTLLVCRWCSLCDTMRDAAKPVAASHGFRIDEVDLDAHPEWEARFGERVPVLLLGAAPDGEVLAELRLEAGSLDASLMKARVAFDPDFR